MLPAVLINFRFSQPRTSFILLKLHLARDHSIGKIDVVLQRDPLYNPRARVSHLFALCPHPFVVPGCQTLQVVL
jgi:hypothetical protein